MTVIRLKKAVLLMGDVLVLYFSLLLMLVLRYGKLDRDTTHDHLIPFSILFGVWILTLYVGGLYDFRHLRQGNAFLNRASIIFGINGFVAVLFFYFLPSFAITPRLNLFLFLAVAAIFGLIWRTLANMLLSNGLPTKKILLAGDGPIAEHLAHYLHENPQHGYRLAFWMKKGLRDHEFHHLYQIILAHKISTIVMPAHLKKDVGATRLIYRNLVLGIEVMDLATLYERVFQKVPLAELEEGWFLENIAKSHEFYETLKRPIEIVLSLALLIGLAPLFLILALAVRLTSRGPAIFSQERIGQGGRRIRVYKFRTMRIDAERDGPQWSKAHDPRNTPFGSFLRRTHLDEFPQLWNVLKGELSFIGPRPERPEFVALIEQSVPFYTLRHLVRPGVSGWAQVNYRYGASVTDAYEKLQYDIYYLKNRSVVLDTLITLRTIRFFVSNL